MGDMPPPPAKICSEVDVPLKFQGGIKIEGKKLRKEKSRKIAKLPV